MAGRTERRRQPSSGWQMFFLAVLTTALALLANARVALGKKEEGVVNFCKCTCGQNTTVIELTRFALEHLPHASEPIDVDTLVPGNMCMNCTRSLCGIAEPGLCDGAAVDDEIVPLCFQRDSLQDEVIVTGFLLLVVALLVWAAVRNHARPVVERLWNQYGYARVPPPRSAGEQQQ
ncbi:hypothetical protein IWW48_004125 [Coemansia sp. RSA 1200]|nr:hypothetical protein IWW48_004125 [Coemansia sp. RSA 1200]